MQWVGGGAGDESHHKEGKEGRRRMGKNLGVVFPVILRLGFLESIDKSIGTQAGCASLQ